MPVASPALKVGAVVIPDATKLAWPRPWPTALVIAVCQILVFSAVFAVRLTAASAGLLVRTVYDVWARWATITPETMGAGAVKAGGDVDGKKGGGTACPRPFSQLAFDPSERPSCS